MNFAGIPAHLTERYSIIIATHIGRDGGVDCRVVSCNCGWSVKYPADPAAAAVADHDIGRHLTSRSN